jgi:hypothetical protein
VKKIYPFSQITSISFGTLIECPGLGEGQVVSLEELLISQVVKQEALARLLVEKGVLNPCRYGKSLKVT